MAVRNRISHAVSRLTPTRPSTTGLAHQAHPAPPLWVRAFTNLGRPAVAVIVLIMCAPGEHHLAQLAGWDTRLAWGMAGVLAAYAGIASAVASARPKGAPGKRSAVLGAALSLGAAMAAQPVSHLFVTGHLSAEPRPPVWLVVAVSCVPPLVLGHLLHLAASPVTNAPLPALPKRVPGQALAELAAETGEPTSEPTETDPEPDEPEGEQPAYDRETDPRQRLLTTRQVADHYGVEPSTVNTWRGRKKLTPAVQQPGLGNLYDPAELPPRSELG